MSAGPPGPTAPDPVRALMVEARRALQAGQAHQASALARRLAKLQPDRPDLLNYGASIAHQAGDARAATRLLEQSLRADRNQVEALSNLASLYHAEGRHAEAVDLLDRALALDDALASLHYNRGNGLKALGRLEAAEQAFRAALARQPNMPAFHGNLANTLVALGQLSDAADAYRASLALRPGHAETHRHLGNTLRLLKRYDEAAAECRLAIGLDPNEGENYGALGAVLDDLGDAEGSIAAYRRATELRPDDATLRAGLGAALVRAAQYQAGIEQCRQATRLAPDIGRPYWTLGVALTQQGRLAEARAAAEHAVTLMPDDYGPESSLLFLLNYLPDMGADDIARRHLAWDARHMRRWLPASAAYPNAADPDRRLRIGYLSPDFRAHAVGDFLMPLLANHDRARVEITGYSQVRKPDRRTAAFQTLTDRWRVVAELGDAAVADQIRSDEVDILVDVAGHTADHRLAVFARRPAPLQVTWLGYPSTTGMTAMDYRLTDAIADPAPAADRLHSERLVRLENGFLSYQPPRAAPAVADPPMLAHGAITFGSFNNLAKVNDQVVACWRRLLDAEPRSRLVLKAHQLNDAPTRADIAARLTAAGLAADRVTLLPGLAKWTEHMAEYGAIDIALDPFPYNGTTTTCEALWMGVPVITRRGDRHAARVGASLLTRVGLSELIAEDCDDYIAKARALADDRERLVALRRGLRSRIAASPLGDAARLAREVEAAYRDIWQAWCRSRTRRADAP